MTDISKEAVENLAEALVRINANYDLSRGIHFDITKAAATLRSQAEEIERLRAMLAASPLRDSQ